LPAKAHAWQLLRIAFCWQNKKGHIFYDHRKDILKDIFLYVFIFLALCKQDCRRTYDLFRMLLDQEVLLYYVLSEQYFLEWELAAYFVAQNRRKKT